MMDRRTFLKVSASALMLAAAAALTGCGSTGDNRPKVTIDGVDFICESPALITGGSGYRIQYKPLFAIQNNSANTVTIRPEDISGVFTDEQGNRYPLDFTSRALTVQPKAYAEYRTDFTLESENTVPAQNSTGAYELRVKYNGRTAVFRSDGSGKKIVPGVE